MSTETRVDRSEDWRMEIAADVVGLTEDIVEQGVENDLYERAFCMLEVGANGSVYAGEVKMALLNVGLAQGISSVEKVDIEYREGEWGECVVLRDVNTERALLVLKEIEVEGERGVRFVWRLGARDTLASHDMPYNGQGPSEALAWFVMQAARRNMGQTKNMHTTSFDPINREFGQYFD